MPPDGDVTSLSASGAGVIIAISGRSTTSGRVAPHREEIPHWRTTACMERRVASRYGVTANGLHAETRVSYGEKMEWCGCSPALTGRRDRQSRPAPTIPRESGDHRGGD
jgi:hypothetical protein